MSEASSSQPTVLVYPGDTTEELRRTFVEALTQELVIVDTPYTLQVTSNSEESQALVEATLKALLKLPRSALTSSKVTALATMAPYVVLHRINHRDGSDHTIEGPATARVMADLATYTKG